MQSPPDPHSDLPHSRLFHILPTNQFLRPKHYIHGQVHLSYCQTPLDQFSELVTFIIVRINYLTGATEGGKVYLANNPSWLRTHSVLE